MATSSEIGAYAGGVAVALLSTSTSATGLLLQKLTHKSREHLPKPLPPVWRKWKWLAGLGCLFAGSLLSLAVFALLGQSRASAMAAVTIAINAVLATWCLGETFTRIDLATTALIGAGTTISVVFGASGGGPDINYNVNTIISLLQRTIVYITSGSFAGAYLLLFTFLWWTNKRGAQRGLLEQKLECFARALCAGIFSGTTGFLTKSVVVCVTNMWHTHDYTDLQRWPFYVLVVGLPCSLVLQLRYLNSGLRRFDAMEMVPPYQSSIVTIGVLCGWIFFDEADGIPPFSMAMFGAGCAVSILGISLLLAKPKKQTGTREGGYAAVDSASSSSSSSSAAHGVVDAISLKAVQRSGAAAGTGTGDTSLGGAISGNDGEAEGLLSGAVVTVSGAALQPSNGPSNVSNTGTGPTAVPTASASGRRRVSATMHDALLADETKQSGRRRSSGATGSVGAGNGSYVAPLQFDHQFEITVGSPPAGAANASAAGGGGGGSVWANGFTSRPPLEESTGLGLGLHRRTHSTASASSATPRPGPGQAGGSAGSTASAHALSGALVDGAHPSSSTRSTHSALGSLQQRQGRGHGPSPSAGASGSTGTGKPLIHGDISPPFHPPGSSPSHHHHHHGDGSASASAGPSMEEVVAERRLSIVDGGFLEAAEAVSEAVAAAVQRVRSGTAESVHSRLS